MSLSKLLAEYVSERGVAKCTQDRMARAIGIFSQFLTRPATRKDLTDSKLNDWIQWLLLLYRAKSAKEFRGDILALWRFLACRKEVPWPGRVRIVKVDVPVPVAWTADEMRRLLETCLTVRHGEYLQLLFRVAYDTGYRRSDLLRIDASTLDANNTVRLVQSKTRRGHVARLDTKTADDLRRRGNLRPPVGVRRLYRIIEKVISLAKIRPGAMQMTRRTGATQVEMNQPGAAQRYLGHATAGLAYKYYVDWSQVSRPVEPPRIW